ncbi:serine/threonine-protein kinase [Mycoplasmopsis synoviae]|uniref:serine/threonine-protein kinase n=1 Tax=Mycoplasmopsis synoviae TaxID=2109 RepID=UPI003563F425
MNNSNIINDSNVYKKYEIISPLGEGGYANVFKIKSKFNNKYYALKYLNIQNKNSEFERFTNEAHLIKNLNTEYVPKIFEFYKDTKEAYMVLELINGSLVSEKLKAHGRINVKDAIQIIKSIAYAVQEIHSHKIIHRDIKSDNIYITIDGKIKIIDFGISIEDDVDQQRFTRESSVACSPFFMAPEIVNRNKPINKSVDIYAIGILFYEMITGKVPFKGKTASETIKKHLSSEIPNPQSEVEEIPNSVVNIIYKALQKDPEKRYKSTLDLIFDLENSLNPKFLNQSLFNPKNLQEKKNFSWFIQSKFFLVSIFSFIALCFIGIFVLLHFFGVY